MKTSSLTETIAIQKAYNQILHESYLKKVNRNMNIEERQIEYWASLANEREGNYQNLQESTETNEAEVENKSQKPHSQFQARIETITENGKEVKTIPITKHLAEWLSQIEAKEGYDDIIDRLLKGSEVPVNLNVPIKRVLVSLVK